MDLNFNLVVFLANDWSQFFRRYLFLAMAKVNMDCKILCIQRPLCFFTSPFLNRKKIVDRFIRKEKLVRLLPNLFIYQPIVFLHDHLAPHVPFAIASNRRILKWQLTKQIDKLGLRKDKLVSWISDPIQEEYLDLVHEKLSIYDCFDDYWAYGDNSFWKGFNQLIIREKRILEKVDIVFTVSMELYEKKSKVNKNTYLIPNAADAELFGKASEESTSVPSDLLNVSNPIIGMVGNLHQRIDFELIRYLAETHPEWSFVIVGDWVGADRKIINSDLIKKLKKKTNVHWMGHQPLEILPNYLKAFDVCLIPYAAENPLNISSSPLKLYEYLAAGKPIVSTNLPSVREYSDIIHIGNNYEEIEKGIKLALEEKGEWQEKRKKTAKDNSWDNRAKEIFSIIQSNETLIGFN